MSFYHKSNSVVCFLFFKQKTAYEMRISDWSSDVCSSDLQAVLARIAREDVAETRRDDAADTEVGERPHRMFARRAAAEIAIGDQNPRIATGRPVEDEILAFASLFVEAQFAKRSEEHTSELQSLMRISYAVFCLKKKITLKTQQLHKVMYTHKRK